MSQQSDFARKAGRIGQGIHSTSQKLHKLAQLAKRTSKFDDPAQEINELSTLVKQDIQTLNVAIADLQALSARTTDGNKQSISHSHTVVDNLRTRLKDTTKDFKDVLTKRTEVLKSNQDRRNLFSIRPDEGKLRSPCLVARLATQLRTGAAGVITTCLSSKIIISIGRLPSDRGKGSKSLACLMH